MNDIAEADARAEWQEHLANVAAEQEPGWEARYVPGSFGCHELLDRIHVVGDLLEDRVLNHPACALREDWHRLAAKAAEALRELYQAVGSEHLSAERPG